MTIDDVRDYLDPAIGYREIDCDEGWDDLIVGLHESILRIAPRYRLLQIKQKLGMLRYYVSVPDNRCVGEVYELIREAERKSSYTCELCGSEPATLRVGPSWWKTICSSCYGKLPHAA